MATGPFVIIDHLSHITLAGHRPRTIQSRKKVLKAFSNHLDPGSLQTATRRDVESFLSRDLSQASRCTYLNHLRGFYHWALDVELVTEDPTVKVHTSRPRRGTPRPISMDDLCEALDHAPPRMRAWLLLMAFAGLRCLEVAALRPQDVMVSDGVTLLFLRECKGGGTATVPAHPDVLEALAYLPVRDGMWWDVTANTVSTGVSQYLHGLGLNATAHQLRHTAGTAWYRASGHDLLTTATLLRHARVDTTQIYSQLDPSRPAEVVNLVALPRASGH